MKKIYLLFLLFLCLPVAASASFTKQITPPDQIDPNYKIAIVLPNPDNTGYVALYTYDYYQVLLNLNKECAGGVKAPCLDANTGGAFMVYKIPDDGVMAFSMPHDIVQSYKLNSDDTSEILTSVDLLKDDGQMLKANTPKNFFIGSGPLSPDDFNNSKTSGNLSARSKFIILLVIIVIGAIVWFLPRFLKKAK